jgi:hypothetical protein
VEGRAADSWNAELLEPPAHLAGGLVREGHGEDLVSPKSPALDLVRDPVRDRRRLPRARPREDADRPAHRLDGTPLLRIQVLEHPGHATARARRQLCRNCAGFQHRPTKV